jgi:hypothetical protein
MAADQNCCPERQCFLIGSSLTIPFHLAGSHRLVGDVSTGIFCLVVPVKFRKDIFFHLHNTSHPGRHASHHLVSSRYMWCSLAKCGSLGEDLPAHTLRHIKTRTLNIPVPQRCFPIFTSIWWARYNLVIIATLLLPSLTAHPN